MDGREKRQSPRVAATFKVEYESLDKFLLEYAEDISRGGIFLATTSMLTLGTVVRLILHLPDSPEKVEIVGQVVHHRTPAEAARKRQNPGVGVEFLDIDDMALLRIRSFVDGRTPEVPPARPSGSRPIAVRQIDTLLAVRDDGLGAAIAEAFGPDFRVRVAGTGMHALSECADKPPRVLVVAPDVDAMPGPDLVRAVRQRPALSELPVLLLTRGAGEASRKAALDAGADEVVGWPASPTDLRARAERLLLHATTPTQEGDRRALRGSIADLGLGSLFSLLELEKKSGYLLVVREGETGMLGFRQGRIVHADVRPSHLRGKEKVFYVLDWPDGRFEFVSQDVGPGDDIGTSVNGLLMQHAQLTDGDEDDREAR